MSDRFHRPLQQAHACQVRDALRERALGQEELQQYVASLSPEALVELGAETWGRLPQRFVAELVAQRTGTEPSHNSVGHVPNAAAAATPRLRFRDRYANSIHHAAWAIELLPVPVRTTALGLSVGLLTFIAVAVTARLTIYSGVL